VQTFSTPQPGRNSSPMVSVIMPAYLVTKYIGEAITSVLNQTFTDYEIFVVNDGSPDTAELELALSPFRNRIVYSSQPNSGCSAARNAALREARGKYIALLDGDDLWEPDYLSVQVALLEANPAIDVLYPDALIFGDTPDAGKTFMEVLPSNGEVTTEALVTQRCTVMISVTAKRETVVRAGMFDERLMGSEDFDLWLRILHCGGQIAYHRRMLVHYRRRPDSLSADPVRMCQQILKVLEYAEARNNLTKTESDALRQQIRRFRALASFHEGKRDLFAGNTLSAISKLRNANIFLRSPKISLALMILRTSPQLLLQAYKFRHRFFIEKPS